MSFLIGVLMIAVALLMILYVGGMKALYVEAADRYSRDFLHTWAQHQAIRNWSQIDWLANQHPWIWKMASPLPGSLEALFSWSNLPVLGWVAAFFRGVGYLARWNYLSERIRNAENAAIEESLKDEKRGRFQSSATTVSVQIRVPVAESSLWTRIVDGIIFAVIAAIVAQLIMVWTGLVK